MFNDILDWITYWTVMFGIRATEWIQRTTEYAGLFFFKSRLLFQTLWGALTFQTAHTTVNWVRAAIALMQKIGEIFEYRYFYVEEIFTVLVQKWRTTFWDWWDKLWLIFETSWDVVEKLYKEWWARLWMVFETSWEWVEKWYADWVVYVTWLFENYKERIHYALVTDWPKLAWLIIDRFEDLHNIIEFHLPGWKTFIDDPAQALWDWVKPRLQELVATFLVELW